MGTMQFKLTSYGREIGYNLNNLSLLESLVSDFDPRPVVDQMQENYAHGGGWDDFKGFTMQPNGSLAFPGDPTLHAIAVAHVREERVTYYEGEWMAVTQPNGDFSVSRVD